ncbi:hypothetical protein PSCLAVI8L_170048 [Pseudoclavibacter sp. 8L]|nr:hypothetical protein PSCLAVI8L_170048 [Pseudoclavibacter sp. 8L]
MGRRSLCRERHVVARPRRGRQEGLPGGADADPGCVQRGPVGGAWGWQRRGAGGRRPPIRVDQRQLAGQVPDGRAVHEPRRDVRRRRALRQELHARPRDGRRVRARRDAHLRRAHPRLAEPHYHPAELNPRLARHDQPS